VFSKSVNGTHSGVETNRTSPWPPDVGVYLLGRETIAEAVRCLSELAKRSCCDLQYFAKRGTQIQY